MPKFHEEDRRGKLYRRKVSLSKTKPFNKDALIRHFVRNVRILAIFCNRGTSHLSRGFFFNTTISDYKCADSGFI